MILPFTLGKSLSDRISSSRPHGDGDFGPLWYTVFNPSALPNPWSFPFFILSCRRGGLALVEETNYQEYTHLVVSNDVVTDFFLTGQYGAADPNFRFSDFYVSNGLVVIDGQARSTYTSGTMSFGAPVPIPDGSTATAGLVAFGVLGITLFRHKKRAALRLP